MSRSQHSAGALARLLRFARNVRSAAGSAAEVRRRLDHAEAELARVGVETAGAAETGARLSQAEAEIARMRAALRGEMAARRWGVAIDIAKADDIQSVPYRPDRAGLHLRYIGNLLSRAQPDLLWFDSRPERHGPMLLGGTEPLVPDDRLVVLDDRPFDLSVGVPMIHVRHARSGRDGFITEETLVAETVESEGMLWTAVDKPRLRNLVEFASPFGTLYSTNRVSPNEIASTTEYLQRFGATPAPADSPPEAVHPLQAGAHAHRIGVWALAADRSLPEREQVTENLRAMLEHYGIPAANDFEGTLAWPYTFDFSMPWLTALPKPWYSGYANSAMAGACACAWRLTGDPRHRAAALKAIGFLRRPMHAGGALYDIDGFSHVAEYCYASPPIPNYRVLDGEICSLVFLYNAALLLDDPSVMRFAMELVPGLARALDFFADPEGLPLFGMDGQPMNPTYMWQLWMSLQLLANAFKDRRFAVHAERWRHGIPQDSIDDSYPL
jgi:hypothetical protein